jgi:predicted exporter
MNRLAHKSLAAGIALLLLALALMLMNGRARVTTDIFELLPEDRRDAMAAAAMAQSREGLFRGISAVITAPAVRKVM